MEDGYPGVVWRDRREKEEGRERRREERVEEKVDLLMKGG